MRLLGTARSRPPQAPDHPGERRTPARFLADAGAATAVEFALVATPLLFLIGAIFELAILFLAAQVLDSATTDAGRLIRTGQFKTVAPTQAAFKTEVCNRLYLLFDCANVAVEAKTYTNFAGITDLSSMTAYKDTNGNFDTTKVTTYQPGSGSSIVVVRVFYPYPVLFKNLLWDETRAPGGKVLLTGVAAFRNEPFP